jgi:small subunit ribosomal protein S16
MLAIRMQRTGRKGHAQFRVVVQDAHRSPTSGSIVAQIGHYNPHSKEAVLDKEKAEFYISHGAQPSPRAVKLLTSEGVKLPDWVKVVDDSKQRATRNADKRRSTRPAEPEVPAAEEPVVAEGAEEAPAEAVAAEEAANVPAVDAPTEAATPEAEVAETVAEDAPVEAEASEETPEPEAEDVSEETKA